MAVQRDNANVNRQLWGESRQSGVEAQVGFRNGSPPGQFEAMRPLQPDLGHFHQEANADAHTVPSARSVALLPLPPTINGLILG
mmetsp:Transcript_6097/g.9200  ORF Transcript_6097/g.9200 Transcript_6097/m.9200 type:complete len:84 (-) Transcript_6097:18-269(-)